MSVSLVQLSIQNFKSIKFLELELSNFTPLVGYNNAGKSNILTAIQWLLRKSSLTDNDFFDCEKSVIIQAKFQGINEDILDCLDSKHKNKIIPFINNDFISIRRIQQSPNLKTSEIRLEILNPATSQWDVNPTGIDNALNVLFPEPIRIGAMENSTEDASKAKTTTTIGKLLNEFVFTIRENHEKELLSHFESINNKIAFDGIERLSELEVIDNSINNKILDIFPDIKLKLDFSIPTFDEIIKSGTIRIYENEDAARNFSSYGHGTQRSVQIALIRHLAEIKQDSNSYGTTLLLIDEPELYLHPLAIEHTRKALKSLSENGYQVIFSTHSSQMIKSEDAINTLLIRKNRENGTYCRKRIKDAVNQCVKASPHQIEYLFSLTNSSDILFCEKAILTEGKSELKLLPKLFEKINAFSLGQYKFALIQQGGVNNTAKTIEILKAMDLPCKAIVDLDFAFHGAVKSKLIELEDRDLVYIKTQVPKVAATYNFEIDKSTNLPKNSYKMSASRAFEIIAAQDDLKPYINSLHEKLKTKNIWVWRCGAIEKVLNLSGKDESVWSQFNKDIGIQNSESLKSSYPEIVSLFEWILE